MTIHISESMWVEWSRGLYLTSFYLQFDHTYPDEVVGKVVTWAVQEIALKVRIARANDVFK